MAEIRVLSAGAVKAGLAEAGRIFETQTGHNVVIAFATAPVLRSRLEMGGAQADVLVAPVQALEAFEGDGWVMTEPHVVVGNIKAGVAVREGARLPDISGAKVFKQEILAARSLVYNEASSGLYIERLMEKLGIAKQVSPKTRRFPTGGAVMEYLAGSSEDAEIGFGQVTEILVYQGKGVALVGPLPEEIGNVTTYGARVLAQGPEAGKEFVRFLSTPSARVSFAATGMG